MTPLICIINENTVYVIACFKTFSLILQTINYRGNDKYVLVLVNCQDAILLKNPHLRVIFLS